MGRRPAAALVGIACALLLLGGDAAFGVPGDRSATPPPTPVPPRGSPSPFISSLRTPPPSAEAPDVPAPAAALADLDTGQILWAVGPRQERAIASVTKIMTALLVLKRTDPADLVTVSERAAPGGPTLGISNLGLEVGERVRVEDLLYALMLQSANDAAVALAEHVSGSVEAFVRDMNEEARRMRLRDTRFYSPNGLDDRGYSSARDLVRLTVSAYRQPGFERIATAKFREIPSPEGDPRIVQNRNVLLWLYPGAIGVKTGYTSEARFCIVAAAERNGIRLVAVVLGSAGEAFSDAAEVLNHGFAAFERHRFVRAGDPFGRLQLQGGGVPVTAAEGLVALVRTDVIDRVELLPRPDRRALFPPLSGERVGTLTVRAPRLLLGRVPLVASDVPPPPEPEAGWWLSRSLSSFLDALTSAFGSLLA